MKRLESVLVFLDAVRNEDALLINENRTGITRGRTIQTALKDLGLTHALGSVKTVGEVRQFISLYRDDLAEFIKGRTANEGDTSA
jgi:hypothetical protein